MWPWGKDRAAGDHHPPEWFGHEGIDLRVDEQLALLSELEGGEYQEIFDALRRDSALSSSDDARGASPPLIRNGYFPSPDAELYAAMIVRERPRRIVEVGSGFSTLVARRALDRCGLDCPLHVVDPEPRVDVDGVADSVERRLVEDGGLEVEAGSLLFIDSSHTGVSGGDGPYLYCDLLPSLPPGVVVHVHDIYIPFDYPAVYVRRGYTEQYLLHALLAGSDAMEVVCTPYFLSRRYAGAMRAAFGEGVARDHSFEGASFWMRTH